MNKYILLIFSLLLVVGTSQAQSRKAYRKAAKSAFEKGDYPAAISYYKILIDNTADSTDIDVLYQAAHAARLMYSYDEASDLYSKILASPDAASRPEAKYYMGMSKFHQMDYAQAISLFKEIESETEDLILKGKAQKAAENAEWALEQMVSGTPIQIHHYGPEVNSPFIDVAPYWYDDALHFTTVRGYDSTMHMDDFEGVTRIYKLSDGTSEGSPISGNPTDEKMHSANFVVNNDGNRKYLNYCSQISSEKFHCKLFYYETKPDGSEEFIAMPNYINNDTFTTAEPAVGIDEAGNEVVYFVSDRPGGMGGLDIWYTTNIEGIWSQPQNLSALNTAGDDVTPFFHLPSKTMFFSSNARQGMGNFDIYKSTWRVDEWTTPDHTGFPINGGYDDTYFSFNSERALGTFVSNRPGCMCHSEENNCKCNDIYSYEIAVDVDLLVFNKYNEDELAGATVTLVDTETGEIVKVMDNFDGNNFNFPLSLEKTYRLVASKEGWASDSIEFNTRGIFLPTSIEQKLYLEPSVKLEVLVFDALTRLPLKGATIGFTEVGGAGILEETNDTGNDFQYDLTFGKNYQLLASKDGYDEGAASASTVDLSSPQIIKREIYLNPFGGELVLYFDNDYPKYPRKPINTDTTLQYYGETFENYYYDKKELFVQEYSKGRTGDQKKILDASMRDFFDSEIKGNYEKLNEYCRLLQLYLSKNPSKKLEVLMEGFASPLATSDYNVHLTNRRIVCVINHFRNYEGGILREYIDREAPRLVFTRVSNGEKASAPVDDSRANPRESIFSRKASIERRVQISEIREYLPGVSSLNKRGIQRSQSRK